MTTDLVPNTSLPAPPSVPNLITAARGNVCLLYGSDAVFPVAMRVAAHAMTNNIAVAAVDGCNRFNVHLLARHARERRIPPTSFLRRVYVSRGFTCYQMEAVVTRRLPMFLRSKRAGAVMILGLLDTLYDEQAPFREVQQILERMLRSLHALKANGTPVLIACQEFNVVPPERNQLFVRLRSRADLIYHVTLNEHRHPVVQRELVSPGRTALPSHHQK